MTKQSQKLREIADKYEEGFFTEDYDALHAIADELARQVEPPATKEPVAWWYPDGEIKARVTHKPAMVTALYDGPHVVAHEPDDSERARIFDVMLLKFQSVVSGVAKLHHEYVGKEMPVDVYSGFAMARDVTIPAMRRALATLAAPRAEVEMLTECQLKDLVVQRSGFREPWGAGSSRADAFEFAEDAITEFCRVNGIALKDLA